MARQKDTASYTRVLSFRFSTALADRIEAATERLSKDTKGAKVTRASVVFMLIERGLDAFEKELKPKRR